MIGRIVALLKHGQDPNWTSIYCHLLSSLSFSLLFLLISFFEIQLQSKKYYSSAQGAPLRQAPWGNCLIAPLVVTPRVFRDHQHSGCYRVQGSASAHGNVALDDVARHLDCIARSWLSHTCRRHDVRMYVEESCWMRLNVGARGLHRLGARGPHRAPRFVTEVGITLRGPADVISDRMLIQICRPHPPLSSIITDCTPYTVGRLRLPSNDCSCSRKSYSDKQQFY